MIRYAAAPVVDWLARDPGKSTRWALGMGLIGLLVLAACATGARLSTPLPVTPLGHPVLDQRIAQTGWNEDSAYRFVVFGDQKNLFDTEFPLLVQDVQRLIGEGPPLLFLIDTGDIVDSGLDPGQFDTLREILEPLSEIPYLVSVGNHEIESTDPIARAHTSTFLGGGIAGGRDATSFSPDTLYYEKQIGQVRFLFLDSNDLVYEEADTERANAQIAWLDSLLLIRERTTVVVMHHPFVLSADRHRENGVKLWTEEYADGRTLPERLIDGGVDLVLSGHVHSYEAFLLEREGQQMLSVNASGVPNGYWLWDWTKWGKAGRRPKNWEEDEMAELAAAGFTTRLNEWAITQLDRDREDSNQFLEVTVSSQGELSIVVRTSSGELNSFEIR